MMLTITQLYTKYFIHTGAAPVLTQITNKVFDLTNVSPGSQPTAAQIVTTTNAYNTSQHKLSQQVVQNSDGSITTTNTKYSKDYDITTAGDTYLANLVALQHDNLNIPIETYTQFTPVGGTQVTIGADLQLFGTFPLQGINQANGPAPLMHKKFVAPYGVTNFSASSISNTNTLQWDSRYITSENDLGYDYTGFLLSKNDGFNHITTTIYDNYNTYRLRANISNASYDQIGIDCQVYSYLGGRNFTSTGPTNAFSFSFLSKDLISPGSAYRMGVPSISFPSTETLVKTLNKNPSAKNYIFSMWVNSSSSGQITATLTDGTTTLTQPIKFAATAGNTSTYPTGFQYIRDSIPVTNLSSTTPLTASISTSANINASDIFCYPDVANITSYAYDGYDNKIASTDRNGISTYYNYDALGRLTYVYDQDDNIIERKTYVNNNPAINSVPRVNLSWTNQGYGQTTNPSVLDILLTFPVRQLALIRVRLMVLRSINGVLEMAIPKVALI